MVVRGASAAAARGRRTDVATFSEGWAAIVSVSIQPLEPRRLFNAINGVVFNDRNNNATYESAGPDIPWPGVTVYLDGNNNGQLDAGEQSTVTASYASGDGGAYHF